MSIIKKAIILSFGFTIMIIIIIICLIRFTTVNYHATPTLNFSATRSLDPTYLFWTPIDTLSPSIADPTITAIYQRNSCQLPCWQGIVPGKTSWEEAWQFLGPIAKNEFPYQYKFETGDDSYYLFSVYLLKPEGNFPFGTISFSIRRNDFTVDIINMDAGNEPDFKIPEIFKEYGKPEGIFYKDDAREGGYNIYLYLSYAKKGFVLSYFATFDTNDWTRRKERICFQKDIFLSVWSPQLHEVFPSSSGFSKLGIPEVDEYSLKYIVPISRVTDMTEDEFYNAYVNEKGDVCMSVDLEYFEDIT